MYNLYTVKHCEATLLDLERAIELKSKAWPYPKESQMQWIRDNLKQEDLHVFLMEDGKGVAYLNIAMVQAHINGVLTTCAGVGNVCSSKKGGGKKLIINTNKLISELNIPGILFCRDRLVDFYIRCDWKLLNPERLTISHFEESINTMVFNLDLDSSIVYSDRFF